MTSGPDDVIGAVDLSKAIGANVARVRAELRWSQKDLAAALSARGSGWSRQTVGMLETQGVRAERLQDVAQLCEALQVPLRELLAGDVTVEFRHGRTESLAWVWKTLDGQHLPPRESPPAGELLVSGIGQDDPAENARIASSFGLTESELRASVLEYTGGGTSSATQLRDRKAGIKKTMTRSEARARRGHATREMKRELVDGEPIASFNSSAFAKWLSECGERPALTEAEDGQH